PRPSIVPTKSGWSSRKTPFAFGLTITGMCQASARRRSGPGTASLLASIPTRRSGRSLSCRRAAAARTASSSIAGTCSVAKRGSAVEVGLRDSGHEIRRTGAERAEAHTRNAGEGRCCLSHECGGRLVFGQHELEACLTESFDEVDDLPAGMPEHVPDARCAEA